MGMWGAILLGIWLVCVGLMQLVHFSFQYSAVVLALLAFGAGIFLFVDGMRNRFSHNIGGLLLSVWLIARAIQSLGNFPAPVGVVLSVVAVAAGILLLVRR